MPLKSPMRKNLLIPCSICQSLFLTKRLGSQFCSPECTNAYHRGHRSANLTQIDEKVWYHPTIGEVERVHVVPDAIICRHDYRARSLPTAAGVMVSCGLLRAWRQNVLTSDLVYRAVRGVNLYLLSYLGEWLVEACNIGMEHHPLTRDLPEHTGPAKGRWVALSDAAVLPHLSWLDELTLDPGFFISDPIPRGRGAPKRFRMTPSMEERRKMGPQAVTKLADRALARLIELTTVEFDQSDSDYDLANFLTMLRNEQTSRIEARTQIQPGVWRVERYIVVTPNEIVPTERPGVRTWQLRRLASGGPASADNQQESNEGAIEPRNYRSVMSAIRANYQKFLNGCEVIQSRFSVGDAKRAASSGTDVFGYALEIDPSLVYLDYRDALTASERLPEHCRVVGVKTF